MIPHGIHNFIESSAIPLPNRPSPQVLRRAYFRPTCNPTWTPKPRKHASSAASNSWGGWNISNTLSTWALVEPFKPRPTEDTKNKVNRKEKKRRWFKINIFLINIVWSKFEQNNWVEGYKYKLLDSNHFVIRQSAIQEILNLCWICFNKVLVNFTKRPISLM